MIIKIIPSIKPGIVLGVINVFFHSIPTSTPMLIIDIFHINLIITFVIYVICGY